MLTHQFLSVKVGESVEISLKNLNASGYSWKIVPENPQTVKIEIKKAENEPGEPPVPGESSEEIYLIKAIKPGTETIEFWQIRSWEDDQPPLNKHQIEFRAEN